MKSLGNRIWILQHWLLLACGLVPVGVACAQGTIVYHQPAAPLHPLVGQQLDLNGDGWMDLRFYDASYSPASYWATDASGVGSAHLLVIRNAGVDGGSHLAALPPGTLVGESVSPFLFWAARDEPNASGDALVLGSYDPEEAVGRLVPVGFFYDTTSFMGIQFQINSEWHYGWMRIRGGMAGPSDDGQQFYLNPPGWILDWAYEARPDTPILAGAGIDSDHDGVPDYLDQCPNTSAYAIVDAKGCSIAQLCPCDGPWKNHGEYVKTAKSVADQFRTEGRITMAEQDAIVAQAAQSNCGKAK